MIKTVDAKLMSVVWRRHKPKRAKPIIPDFIMQYKWDEISSLAGASIAAVSAILYALLGLLYLFIGDSVFAKILFSFVAVFVVMILLCKSYADYWKEIFDELREAYNA